MLVSGRCYPTVQNCERYNEATGGCERCISQFYINNQRQCVRLPANCLQANQFGKCTSCAVNYIPRSDGVCIRIIANCRTLDGTNQICQVCNDGYYVNTNGGCSVIPENCQSVSSSGVCERCLTGFTLVNGVCFTSIQFCVNLNPNNGLCIQCDSNYYVNS